MQLAHAVRFDTDVVEREDLFARLLAAKVAVFPSAREGFGIAVLEALACSVPVVTTSAPDNLASELVAASSGGIVCEPTASGLAAGIAATLDSPCDFVCDQSWLESYDWRSVADVVSHVLLGPIGGQSTNGLAGGRR